jgi:hypothetical protein
MSEHIGENELALGVWKVNKDEAEKLAAMVADRVGIPSALIATPEVARFLATLQKLSFIQGSIATLQTMKAALEDLQK